jgi:hypothetical protein
VPAPDPDPDLERARNRFAAVLVIRARVANLKGNVARSGARKGRDRNMDQLRAVMVAEGAEDADEEELREAWQYLVNTGLAWQLQGFFGRTAQQLIDVGFIDAPTVERLSQAEVAIEEADEVVAAEMKKVGDC